MIGYKSRFNKQYILFCCSILFLFYFCMHRFFFFSSSGTIERIFSYPLYPVLIIQNKLSDSVKSFFETKTTINQLKLELDLIKKEKEELLSDYVQLKSALNFFEQISEVFTFKKRYSIDNLKLSKIIMKQVSDQGHYCFIDKGSADGIAKDMVAVYKNCLVGKVSEVYPKYSKIILITDKSCKIAAYCSKTNTTGIYEGSNKIDEAELNYVNHLDKLNIDDLIISSGEGLVFPQGFLIGKLSNFSNEGIQYEATVKPIIDINLIDYCYIMSSYSV